MTPPTSRGIRGEEGESVELRGTIESRARQPDAGGNRTPDPKHRDGYGHHPCRCLVIDDQRIVMDMVANMVGRFGFQVDTADTKPIVTSKVENNAYDLIVTDLMMPDMNGYQLAIEIKKKRPAVKVVIMTGSPDFLCSEMMTGSVVDGWLFKPFGLNDLQGTLTELGFPETDQIRSIY